MLRNYMKTAFRNLFRTKLYASVSVAGLAVGLAVCLLALRYLMYELSFDNIPDKNRIYEVVLNEKYGGATQKFAITPPYLDREMKSYFPEIESAASFRIMPESIEQDGGPVTRHSFCIADSNIFGMLGIKLIQGNPRSCLTDARSVVISRKFASEYFGPVDPIGKTVRAYQYDGRHNFVVTGVMKNLPRRSSISFDGIISSRSDPMMNGTHAWNWNSLAPFCFIKLRGGADAAEMSRNFPSFIRSTGGNPRSITLMKLVPISSIHFMRDYRTGFQTVDPKYLYLISVVALLVLSVSLFNYLGLNITLLTRKAKEIGVRKTSGASHAAIAMQFLVENAMLTVVSFVGGVCISELLLPLFDFTLGIRKEGRFIREDLAGVILFVSVFVVDIAVSLYSTHFFARIGTQSLIKGRLANLNPRKNVRMVLTGLQFSIAAFLICCTVVVVDQLNFIRHKDLGFDPADFLVIDRASTGSRIDVLKNGMRKDPDVTDVTEAGEFPTLGIGGTMSGLYDKGRKSLTLNLIDVDENYLPALGLHLLDGRNFNPGLSSDSAWSSVSPRKFHGVTFNMRVYTGAVLLNREAYTKLNAAGDISDGFVHFVGNTWKLIGIVKDFNYSSLRHTVEPVVLQFSTTPFDYLGVKYRAGRTKQVLGYMRKLWSKSNPGHLLQYSFLDDDVREMYSGEDRMFDAILFGSATAIVIGLMGIFAVTSFIAETKRKEIAIRRTLGSSVSRLVGLLTADFLKLVIIANVIAWPVAYLVMRGWLQNFAYRISVGLWIFPLVGLSMLVLALATVFARASKAARANPVEALRYE